MLQAIRTRAGSIIVKALFALLILSFGFWGIYTRSPYFESRSPDTVIATVGDQSIRAEQLQQALEPALQRLRAQLGGNIDEKQAKQLGIIDTLLGQLIDKSLLDQETARLGLDISDSEIRAVIYENPAFRSPDGRFDRQLFEQALAANRLTENQLVERLRRDIPRSDLLQAITAGARVPPPEVEALYRYRNEKRIADIVALPAAAVKDVGPPSDGDLQKFYDAYKDQFRAPEYRALTIASLAPSDVMPKGEIPEAKLREAYDQRKDELGKPEEREIQQILAPSEEKAKEAEAAVKAGKDWNEIAKGMGQDPDTVDLGLLSRKEIPHELGDIAFQLPLNQPSQPVKSPLGWHILRVVKIEAGKTQSFEEAKPKLENALKMQEAVGRLDKIGNQADDALAGGANLAEVAKKFGLKLTTVAAIDEGGKDADGKPVTLPVAPPEILKTAFATEKGDTSRITDTENGALFAVRVDNITPPAVRPLATVKDKATALWQAEQKRQQAEKQAKALAAAVTPDTPLAKAAGDKGMTALAAVSLGRNQPAKNVPPSLQGKLFAAKPGAIVTASDAAGSYVAQLKQIEIPKTVPPEAEKALAQELAGEARVDVAGEFTEGLRRRFPVEIKRDALDRMF
jgi:peptidyl-prolyl cis-trans isomerase D